jgi:Secretion system C-terminal sorting domain
VAVRPTFAKRPDGGSTWTFGGSTYVNATVRTGFTDFSDFAPIHNSVLLPLNLLSFVGEARENTAFLQWQTSNEVNTAYFLIERSQDGRNFSPVGKQDARGNFAGVSSYNFTDQTPLEGTNYYRLKQVDLDGKFAYSPTLSLTFAGESMLLFPNPNVGKFDIRLPAHAKNKPVRIQIIDATGRVLSTESLAYPETNGLLIDKKLAKGVYIINITTTEKTYRQKMVVL